MRHMQYLFHKSQIRKIVNSWKRDSLYLGLSAPIKIAILFHKRAYLYSHGPGNPPFFRMAAIKTTNSILAIPVKLYPIKYSTKNDGTARGSAVSYIKTLTVQAEG